MPFRFLFYISSLIATGSGSIVAAELRVVMDHEGRSLPLTGADPRHVLVRDGDHTKPAPTDGRWRIEGDWRTALHAFDWLTDYTIARPRKTDAEIDPALPMEVAATLTHRRTVSNNGTFSAGPLLSIWPAGFNEPAALVFVWLVSDQIAHVDVQPAPTPEDFLEFVVHSSTRFSRADAEQCRLGVAAFSATGIIPPRAAFGGETGPRILESLLLDNPASIDRALATPGAREWRDRYGQPPIFAAAQLGAVRVLERLLAAQPAMARAVTETGDTPLHVAARYGRADVVARLVRGKESVDVENKKQESPLLIAARHAHASTVRVLLDAGATVAESGNPPSRHVLTAAITSGDPLTADHVFAADATETSLGTQLVLVAEAGQTAMVRWVVLHGDASTVPIGGNSAVYYAVEKQGDAATIRALLQAGAPVDAKDQQGNTALHAACRRNDLAIALELLTRHANPNSLDTEGNTPLHYAAAHDRDATVGLLLDHGADARLENQNKLQPLECALLAGAPKAARAFARADVRLDLFRHQAVRALEAAVQMDVDAVVAQSLQRGWSPERELRPGWTALAVAQLCGADQVAALLREAQAPEVAALPFAFGPSGELDARPKILEASPPEDPRPESLRVGSLQLIMDLAIDPSGRVIFPRMRERPEGMDLTGVLEAISRWRFAPVTQQGKPVGTQVAVPINFRVKTKALTLSQVDELPRLIQRVDVEFPREVTGKREISAVALRLIVAPNGTVQEPEVLHETGARFGAAALAAVRQWKFEPARRNGEAVPVVLEFPLAWTP